MNPDLRESARRVQQAFSDLGLDSKVLELPQKTRTAVEAAAVIGCGVGQIAKSLVFRTNPSGRALLAVMSGVNRVSESRLGSFAREAVEKADADFVRSKTGFVIGGVPPLAHVEKMTVFLDEDLQQHEVIWAAAGTPFAVFSLTPKQLATITNGAWAPIKD
ncbi:MAG: YbaK/EbsC family protein [Planctomycetes bacterium]|nr:YbaK/EbsC family protein [Planctomycetota bacterium]